MAHESIVVGEGWLSEHFFTTDAKSQSFSARVLQRRKEWDELDADEVPSPRARFTKLRGSLAADLATLAPGAGDDTIVERTYEPLRKALGFLDGGLHLERVGSLLRVSLPGLIDSSPLALIDARPQETLEDLLVKDAPTLLSPVALDDDAHEITSVARLLSALFVETGAPTFALVFAGRWMLLAERERWAEGRYLAVDVQLVADRNDTKRGGEIDRALACLSADSLAPDAEGDIWWTGVLEESIKHTVGVSRDLREGVRLSIEIIANDVVARRRRTGLHALPSSEAQVLAKQSLRFLYRILFLLYAEASPELKVLPIGAAEYEEGYSLDRLRELTLVTLATEAGEYATHLYSSLRTLFDLVDQGHAPTTDDDRRDGLTFQSLRADLFLPSATAYIDEVGLSDAELQKVLAHLLLSKEQKGRDRGFISYSDLGINQLGAVYEGLMSYTGYFAETDLYEVARDGDASKGSWIVPVERSEGIAEKDFVETTNPVTGEAQAVLHPAGTFVYRLAGRERQQSASYYTPEVLTRFVVSQALEELLDQGGHTTTADEILGLTVCEPALGSGAFAIEAVRQLAEQYLRRRQVELDEKIDPDDYPRELQKVKASIALHQVYGVDLNSTAVELAEISLWLDTMSEDLQAPWFGLHLRRGNSLIGARRSVYSRDQVNSKAWQRAVPRDVTLAELRSNLESGALAGQTAGAVHHFLLPAEGWGGAVDAKEGKELAPDALTELKTWRKQILMKPTKLQLDKLVNLAYRVETLWQFALRRLEIAEHEIRRAIPLWGAIDAADEAIPHVTREQIEQKLADANGAYQRLHRVMDAWCAMWFWPLTPTLTDGVTPPTFEEWIGGLTAILGTHFETSKRAALQGQTTLGLPSGWSELGDAEDVEFGYAGALSISDAMSAHPWLAVSERIAQHQGFFHWELDFATVFARGGFDLQVGNPPWVRPRSDVDALLAEGDPWWQLAVKPTQAQVATKRAETLALPGMPDLLVDGTSDVAALAAFVGNAVNYPHLAGLQPDLYRCFMDLTWRNGSGRGTVGLIHPETHFTDEKAGPLRAATYPRLRRHWQFVNELSLFEIHNLVSYGVHVYGSEQPAPSFDMATSLYHPDTVARSLVHDGSGEEPGLKDHDGKWDLRPHRNRITTVTDETLATWHAVLEDVATPIRQSRMVYAVNRATAGVLAKLAKSKRIGDLSLQFSAGWHEKNDRTKGYFDVEWGPVSSWGEVILQGPHLFVGNPFYKSPNESMLNNKDWSPVDLETLAPDALPTTSYKPAVERSKYDAAYTHWGREKTPARNRYRVAWRNMAANTGERTLIPAIIPPGASHIHGVTSLGTATNVKSLVIAGSSMQSLILDFMVRVAPKSTISPSTVARLPLPNGVHTERLALRGLRLSSLTAGWRQLWEDVFDEEFHRDAWAGGLDYPGRPNISDVLASWTDTTPLRRASDRRQAQIEIDALVALMLGVTADELCTIYRTQFAVLHGYDRSITMFDANGRSVPGAMVMLWRDRRDTLSVEERTVSRGGVDVVLEHPFITMDREEDMRAAYTHFQKMEKDV
ncbi:N-6 DNA methylase [Frigoribacterium sp. CFBP 8766]|uniref:DNA methyltransferase n=1 Tax=Frigoribacterium sp. CFBP 8766 TaxID=2775273 RepID=UPI00177E41CB|nr:DNA methyltransferase [Frigoribacterium sp. CFBP 8766]MBD8584139.1 N-6 DNA methylase [Frigoribacterium sp. CFBP 8766]